MHGPQGKLEQIATERVKRNPDNPRLIFHEDEMERLLRSIKAQGIRVPLTVYQDGNHYVLLDGERRWRCASKLNLPKVPAIVLPKPTRLENILMMFNIHNVRVEWDLMPMALKLREVIELLEKQNESTAPKDLSAVTGVSITTVKRALELLDLPKKYREMLVEEARKPRADQRIKPDLFIEINKALRAIARYVPEVFERVDERAFTDAMVEKYMGDVVKNVVEFRNVSKIARAERAGAERDDAVKHIIRLAEDKKYSVSSAFDDTVRASYMRRDIVTRSESLAESIQEYSENYSLDDDVRTSLKALLTVIRSVIG